MPPLDLDILSTVCAFLTDYPDLLSLSLSCSMLRPLAVRNMLRNRPVVLNKVDTIFKFHNFIFSDAAARLPHLLALEVKIAQNETCPEPEGDDRAIEALLAILHRSPSLLSLELRSSASDPSLGYLDDARLAGAIGKLMTLRELTISGWMQRIDFIGAVRAPLKKLVLRSTTPVGGLDREWSLASLGASLSHIAHSLESLIITRAHVRLEGSPTGSRPTAFTGIQFHAVRSLTLDSLIVVPQLPLLLELFPNLDGTLHLTPHIYNVPDSIDHDTFFKIVREQNGRAQERRCWKRLARLVCDVKTLFALNLTCPVGLTVVLNLMHQPNAAPSRHQWLVESLRDHPPTCLNLQLILFRRPSLSGMIPPEAGATLTHLTLCVRYSKYYICKTSSPHAKRWDDIWRDTLLPAFEHLHCLTHLRLVFHCKVRLHSKPSDSREPVAPAGISDDPLLEDLRPASKFDFAAVACAMADALPSLRYCFLTTSGSVAVRLGAVTSFVERWCESRAWRIAPCQAGPIVDAAIAEAAAAALQGTCRREFRLVELHHDVAEMIIEREDLILSAEEETDRHWDEL